MRVGIRDAERLKDSPSSAPVCALGHLPPHRGEGFGSAQIGRNLVLCGTFEYIYWELGRSAPVGGRAARVYRSYKGGDGSLPPHPALRATFPPRGRLFGGTPSFAPKGEDFRAADSRPYREKSSGAGG